MRDPLGSVAVLNVGAGDLKLSFDPKDPAERKKAAGIVKDMLARGYAILVQVGEENGEPIYKRAKKFDPKTCEYLVAGAPEAPVRNVVTTRRGSQRIAAESTRTVAVARSAGG